MTDHLENLFGMFRLQNGNNLNLTPVQFFVPSKNSSSKSKNSKMYGIWSRSGMANLSVPMSQIQILIQFYFSCVSNNLMTFFLNLKMLTSMA
ncbi:Uncharacterized protein FWK35_00016683 [Aphis craccivora]|uniref:Uncharacterized protein n=1 Tax=Aphis craccivora TaxID=307492 RepID=A0A6G0Y2Z3_APHCR|nr:Uncharacterized protein FWK35_00016683 [Aphis craccivora]